MRITVRPLEDPVSRTFTTIAVASLAARTLSAGLRTTADDLIVYSRALRTSARVLSRHGRALGRSRLAA